MTTHEQQVVRFLSRPSSYPHPVRAVERRETHVSQVFLAGDYAYKLKKPVKFPFLDASTLSLRKKFCRLELSLNRRLAPDIYLGIVPIVAAAGALRLGGRGRVIEWVVQMRRLPENRMLDQLVARRQVTRRDMQGLAGRLMPFFRNASRSRDIDRYGTPEAISRLVLGNLTECAPFLGSLLTETQRQRLEAAYRQFLALHKPTLARRVRERRIIDGHGDLRCENICLTRLPNVFDCVEFQPAFRCGDVVNDFAFLLMDLESRGRQPLAAVLAAAYRRAFHDPTFDAVAAFYKCHRSLVRGKVRGFAWQQHPRTPAGRRIRRLARRHFALAVDYARQFAPPRLILVGGLIGTGKSTLARHLTETLGAVWLRTDEIRLEEFAHLRKQGQGFADGLYAPRVSNAVYRRLIQRAGKSLAQGRVVVCDGTFSRARGRQQLRRIAQTQGASFHFFECTVPRVVALRRIAKRLAGGTDLSEARPEHYDRMKAGYEPVRGWGREAWTRLSDNRPSQHTAAAALAALQRVWGFK
jgi:aminoglycoside phosphotransferase family enzyme/predicted kinase